MYKLIYRYNIICVHKDFFALCYAILCKKSTQALFQHLSYSLVQSMLEQEICFSSVNVQLNTYDFFLLTTNSFHYINFTVLFYSEALVSHKSESIFFIFNLSDFVIITNVFFHLIFVVEELSKTNEVICYLACFDLKHL